MKSRLLKIWQQIGFAVFVTVLTAVLLYLRYGQQGLREQWALWGNDLMQNSSAQIPAHNVVIVEITDGDTAVNGQWPWPRHQLGQLVTRLRNAGASVIVFADVFNQEDLAKTDSSFAASVRDNGVVVARTINPQLVNPIDSIAQAAAAVGVSDVPIDSDGVTRRMDLTTVHGDRVYHSLAVETVRTLMGNHQVGVQHTDQAHSVHLDGLQPWVVPNQARWRIKFNRQIQRINALNTDLSAVKNKVVVVGVATRSVNNWIKTSAGGMRNHEVQAHFVQSLFDRNNLTTPMWADMLEMLVSMLILTSILKAAKANTPYACVPVYLGGVGVIILGSWMLFNTADLVIDWTWPVLSSSSVFVLTFYYHWARKRRSEWIISRRFGDIVNATVLKQLKQKHTEIKTTGELKEITVMNADLRNFALLAAEYGSNAEGLVSAVHEYMDAILPEIVNNQGTVDKLIGDGIVAFWNAPMDVEYHALKSVKTALNMQRQIDKFNSMLTPEETPLCLDIGINTGVAVVGNTGSRKTFNYTAIGDTVKTADNLERLCKQYGVNILVGEQTVTQINRGHTIQALGYTLIELDTVFMESGNAMRVFTVDYVNYYEGPLNDSHVKQHARMLENYYAGKFDTAIRICKELKAEAKLIDYYTTMISKCKAAKAELQEDPASSI